MTDFVEVVDHDFIKLLERGRELIEAETPESINEWFKMDADRIAAETTDETKLSTRMFFVEKYLTDGIDTREHKYLIQELLKLTESMNDSDFISFLQDEYQMMIINGIQNLVSKMKSTEKD